MRLFVRGSMFLLSVVAVGVLVAQGTKADEIKTFCPASKQGGTGIFFRYGEIWPQGYRTQFDEENIERKGDLTKVTFDLSSYNSTKGVLMCEFNDRSRIEIPLPGLLLRCGMTIRNYDSRTKPIQWLDVWCISDDERRPVPNKE